MWKYNYSNELYHAKRGRPKGSRVVNGKVIFPSNFVSIEEQKASNGQYLINGPFNSKMEVSYKTKNPVNSKTSQIRAETSLTNAQTKQKETEAKIEQDRFDRAVAERLRQEAEQAREREAQAKERAAQAEKNYAVSEAYANGAIRRIEAESRSRINEQNAESQNRINELRASGEAEATRILNDFTENRNNIDLEQLRIANELSNERTAKDNKIHFGHEKQNLKQHKKEDKIDYQNSKEASKQLKFGNNIIRKAANETLKQYKIDNDLANKRTANADKMTNKNAKETLNQTKITNDLTNKQREIDIKQRQKSYSIDNKIRLNEDRRKEEADAQKLSAERDKQVISRRAADVLRYDRASKSLDDAGNRLSSGADIVNKISVREREKMDLSGLSNDELRKQIDRYDLEARYNERFASPTKAARGKRVLSNILYGAGVGAKVSGSIASMLASMRSIKKLDFDD